MPSSACLYGAHFALVGDVLFFSTAVNFQVEFDNPVDEAIVISYEWFLDDSLLIEEHGRLFIANIQAGFHQIGVRILSTEGWSGIKKLDFYIDVVPDSMVIQGPDSLNEGDSAVYEATLTLAGGTVINVTQQCTFTVSDAGSFNNNTLNTIVDNVDLNDKYVSITATLTGGNTATKPITILNTTNTGVNHPSIIVVEFYDDISLNAIGFVDNIGVNVNQMPAYTGQNFIPITSLAAEAIVLASDLGTNSVKWRFEFNIIKLISQYPTINDFVFEVKGRANISGMLTGAFSLRTYDAVMTMSGSPGSYMPSVTGGSVITSSGFSTQVIGGANGDYSEANLHSLIRFNFNVPTDTLTYTLAGSTFYSESISENIQRDNCGAGYSGSVVSYTLPAAAFSSIISQVDADNQARAYFDANKQQYANDNGACELITQYHLITDQYGISGNDSGDSCTIGTVVETLYTINSNGIVNVGDWFYKDDGMAGKEVFYTQPFPIGTDISFYWISYFEGATKVWVKLAYDSGIYPNTGDLIMDKGECGGALIGNDYQSETFYSEECEAGESPYPYLYEVPVNTFTALTKQLANEQALEDIANNGQNFANTYGTCIPNNVIIAINRNTPIEALTGITGSYEMRRIANSNELLGTQVIDTINPNTIAVNKYAFNPYVSAFHGVYIVTDNTQVNDLYVEIRASNNITVLDSFIVTAGTTGSWAFRTNPEETGVILNIKETLVTPVVTVSIEIIGNNPQTGPTNKWKFKIFASSPITENVTIISRAFTTMFLDQVLARLAVQLRYLEAPPNLLKKAGQLIVVLQAELMLQI
ncbi:DUF5977 domain-containing protein [Pedobacter frigiditerrae]|uniref:DUF5977 domain-containing protein n=1 Tax=Pedobacter frigiditerrae TaxID=2530452 RepID=UPI00292D52E1|nr:DUF5977 domain-containing protein [Pedobacter frigiditerrae]